jgi:Putative Actinobacterial Holin-X, holin superfamily III
MTNHDQQGPPRSEASTAQLVRELSEQTSRLVRQELELAKAELTVKGKRAGLGAGMFGGASLFGLYALGALIASAIAALALALAVWLAALIVTVVLGAVAGVLALQGRSKLRSAVPPVPEGSVKSIKEDVRMTKERAQRGRSQR